MNLSLCLYFNFVVKSRVSEIVNAQNRCGETALWLTTSFRSSLYPEMAQVAAALLNAGADPNIPSNEVSFKVQKCHLRWQ